MTTKCASCPSPSPSKLRRSTSRTRRATVFSWSLAQSCDYICALRYTEREQTAQLAKLTKENAALKRELARLQVYRAMAYRDPLTGLWNRRYFEERLNEELSRSQRAGPRAAGSR